MAQSCKVLQAVTSEDETNQIVELTKNPAWSLKKRASVVAGFIALLVGGAAAVRWYADPEAFIRDMQQGAKSMVKLKQFGDNSIIKPVRSLFSETNIESLKQIGEKLVYKPIKSRFPKTNAEIIQELRSEKRNMYDAQVTLHNEYIRDNPVVGPRSLPLEEQVDCMNMRGDYNEYAERTCTDDRITNQYAALDARNGYGLAKIEKPPPMPYRESIGEKLARATPQQRRSMVRPPPEGPEWHELYAKHMDYTDKKNDMYRNAKNKYDAQVKENDLLFPFHEKDYLYEMWDEIPEIAKITKDREVLDEQIKKLEEKEASYVFSAGMLDATNGIHMKELFAMYISRFN
jgi:hypothetical protein